MFLSGHSSLTFYRNKILFLNIHEHYKPGYDVSELIEAENLFSRVYRKFSILRACNGVHSNFIQKTSASSFGGKCFHLPLPMYQLLNDFIAVNNDKPYD